MSYASSSPTEVTCNLRDQSTNNLSKKGGFQILMRGLLFPEGTYLGSRGF
jgi:hypothetical protein